MSSGNRGSGRGDGQAGGNQRCRGQRGGGQRERGRGGAVPRGGGNQEIGPLGSDWVADVDARVRERADDGGHEKRDDGGRERGDGGGRGVGSGRGLASALSGRGRGGSDRGAGSESRGGKGDFGQKSKKQDNKLDDPLALSPKRNVGKKSDKASWDPKAGPVSTSPGNKPLSSLSTGIGKRKSKGKAKNEGESRGERQGETLGLYPRGPHQEGQIIPAIEVESTVLDLPLGFSGSPPYSFVSDEPPELIRRSYHSERQYDPHGKKRYFLKNPDPDPDPDSNAKASNKFFQDGDPTAERPRMLMIIPGQGGTFGFGKQYTTESGRKVSGEKLLNHHDNTKHLCFFGNKIGLIGTVACVSCTGIYFEIEGNRLFCAHVNTWHIADGFDGADLGSSEPEHAEIVNAVYHRLILHSKEYGWSRDDVYIKTLTVVCPEPEAQAYAVPEALRLFFGLNYMPYVQKAHGFVIKPGPRGADGGPAGKILACTDAVLKSDDEVRNGRPAYVRDAFPKDVKFFEYKHTNREVVLQQWCYTVGHQWHHVEPSYATRFERRIPVDADTTVQKFASYNMMLKGAGEEGPVTANRKNAENRENGRDWQYVSASGDLFLIQGFRRRDVLPVEE